MPVIQLEPVTDLLIINHDIQQNIVRHELIHAWQYHEYGEADHGPTFRRWVEPLKTDRDCERYAEPKYWVICKECERRDPRYQRSNVVKQPEQYSCGQCDGDISIETP